MFQLLNHFTLLLNFSCGALVALVGGCWPYPVPLILGCFLVDSSFLDLVLGRRGKGRGHML